MKNPKNNFTIIPNWLVDELSGAELKLYCKMYNGWCLMKGPDGWYYRSLSKLKEDMGMSPNSNEHRLLERIKRFEELGILMVERCDRQTNRYKFNEDYMFNHEEDTADEVVHETCSTLLHETCSTLLHETCRVDNTVSNNTVKNNIYKEKEINKEKESNTAGQGSLRNDGVSISSLTNEGDNSIQSKGKRDRQCIDVTVSLSSKSNKGKNKSNTSKDLKDSQNTGLSHNPPSALATPLGVSDSEPHPQVPFTPSPTDTPKWSYGEMFWRLKVKVLNGGGFSEKKVRDYVNRYFIQTGKVTQHEFESELAGLQRLRDNLHPTEKRSEKLEVSAADLDNCVLSDDNLQNEREYQNIEKCRQEAPYAILSNTGHSFTSEPMVMYGT